MKIFYMGGSFFYFFQKDYAFLNIIVHCYNCCILGLQNLV